MQVIARESMYRSDCNGVGEVLTGNQRVWSPKIIAMEKAIAKELRRNCDGARAALGVGLGMGVAASVGACEQHQPRQ
jgi:hypothetical protein